jgi:hypothetical protein
MRWPSLMAAVAAEVVVAVAAEVVVAVVAEVAVAAVAAEVVAAAVAEVAAAGAVEVVAEAVEVALAAARLMPMEPPLGAAGAAAGAALAVTAPRLKRVSIRGRYVRKIRCSGRDGSRSGVFLPLALDDIFTMTSRLTALVSIFLVPVLPGWAAEFELRLEGATAAAFSGTGEVVTADGTVSPLQIAGMVPTQYRFRGRAVVLRLNVTGGPLTAQLYQEGHLVGQGMTSGGPGQVTLSAGVALRRYGLGRPP